MKAAIAFLADFPIQNYVRRMVFELSRQADIEFYGSLLPAHVSLKQPFTFEDMGRLEAWFDSLARRTLPMEIRLDSIYYSEWGGMGIVGLNVVETSALRKLHNQINRELIEVVKDPAGPHDGEEYRFHLTVELGKIGPSDPYKEIYDSQPVKKVSLAFQARYLALFYYSDRPIVSGSFMVYKVMPLGTVQS